MDDLVNSLDVKGEDVKATLGHDPSQIVRYILVLLSTR